jgi:hypothetical protein
VKQVIGLVLQLRLINYKRKNKRERENECNWEGLYINTTLGLFLFFILFSISNYFPLSCV